MGKHLRQRGRRPRHGLTWSEHVGIWFEEHPGDRRALASIIGVSGWAALVAMSLFCG